MVAIATRGVFAHTDALVAVWPVPAGTEQFTLVKGKSGRYGVTITRAPGGSGRDQIDLGPYRVTAPKPTGVGGDAATAIGEHATGVAFDGTWEFPTVTGATLATEQDTPVFIDADGDLTVEPGAEDTPNERIGAVNYPATYNKAAGKLPIAIGV